MPTPNDFNPIVLPFAVTCRDKQTNNVLTSACIQTLHSMTVTSPFLWTMPYIQSVFHIARLLNFLTSEASTIDEWPTDLGSPFIVLDSCMGEALAMVVEVHLHETTRFIEKVDSGEINADPDDEWFCYSEKHDAQSALQLTRDTITVLKEFKQHLAEMGF